MKVAGYATCHILRQCKGDSACMCFWKKYVILRKNGRKEHNADTPTYETITTN